MKSIVVHQSSLWRMVMSIGTRLAFCAVVAGLLPFCATNLAAQGNGYYRFPALHGSTLVFTAEGDLWTVGIEGGMARRLTSNAGVESNAAISPDGALVAFSGQYEGATEAYTIPLTGG